MHESPHQLSGMYFLSRESNDEAPDVSENIDGMDKLTMSKL